MGVGATGAAALTSAREVLAAHGIPAPPVPDNLVPGLVHVADMVWSTRPGGHGPGDAPSVLGEAAREPAGDYVHFGEGGYGAANRRFVYQLVHGRVLVAVDVPWRNVYGRGAGNEMAEAADAVAGVSALLDVVGGLPSGERLLVIAPATGDGGWAVVNASTWAEAVGASEPNWVESENPLDAAREALAGRRA